MSNRNKGVETDCWVSGVIITQGRGVAAGEREGAPETREKDQKGNASNR
uniref:Uncharacterized protein n=1 Tax=Human herpesvirus 2 TaxID=10310 RepID=A0A481TYV4_HHV2|nr:hypothetical protein [Human alphaherpesvirus 2]